MISPLILKAPQTSVRLEPTVSHLQGIDTIKANTQTWTVVES